MEKVIVAGYIATSEGEAALERAMDEARAHQARLVVVNAPKLGAYIDSRGVQPEERVALERRLAESGLETELLSPADGVDATDFILDICKERQAWLVVIGLRKRSTMSKLILGSVAQQVLLHSECAILAVRA